MEGVPIEQIGLTRVVLSKPTHIAPDSLAYMLKLALEKGCKVHAECQERLCVDYSQNEKDVALDGLAAVHVVDCEPVDKGILCLNTEVRVIDINAETEKERSRPGDVDSVKTYSSVSSSSFCSASSYDRRQSSVCRLPCSLKPWRIYGLTKAMKQHLTDELKVKADSCHVVGLRQHTLERLGLEAGSWVVISATTITNETPCNSFASVKEEDPRSEYTEPAEYTEQTRDDMTSKHFVQVFSIQKFVPSQDQAVKRYRSRSTTARNSITGDLLAVGDDIIYLNAYLYFNMTSAFPAILDKFRVIVEVCVYRFISCTL